MAGSITNRDITLLFIRSIIFMNEREGGRLPVKWPLALPARRRTVTYFFHWEVKIMRATFRGGPLNPARGSGGVL